MAKADNRRATTIFAVLADRIADMVSASGRDDLVAGLYLFEELARANPALMRAKRKRALEILSNDDAACEAGKALHELTGQQFQALSEKSDSTTH
jgi:hypothetical protein